jgi:hypothetical protein
VKGCWSWLLCRVVASSDQQAHWCKTWSTVTTSVTAGRLPLHLQVSCKIGTVTRNGSFTSAHHSFQPAAAAVYHRPPGMRSLQAHLQAGAASINTSSSGPTFSLAYDSSSKPGRISQSTGKPMPPGAEFVSKAASKNAKKRANKKAKSGAEGLAAGDDAEEDESAAAAAGAAGGQESSAAASVAGLTEQLAGASVSGEGDAAQKRVRALQKKLRQIQQLKERRDAEGEMLLFAAHARQSTDCISSLRRGERRR